MKILLVVILFSANASASINPLKLHCSRQDHQGDQIYISEIHFTSINPNTEYSRKKKPDLHVEEEESAAIHGEVLSYLVTDRSKQLISGYSLFSITHTDNEISGLTGDPYIRTDGKFSLTKETDKNSGIWNFVYTDLNQECITAEFKCSFSDSSSIAF